MADPWAWVSLLVLEQTNQQQRALEGTFSIFLSFSFLLPPSSSYQEIGVYDTNSLKEEKKRGGMMVYGSSMRCPWGLSAKYCFRLAFLVSRLPW